jgi:hypothetical protein
MRVEFCDHMRDGTRRIAKTLRHMGASVKSEAIIRTFPAK